MAALSGAISSRNIAKTKFWTRKSFNATGAHSSDAKVTLPSQTGVAWVQLLSHQISLNSKIVCHLAELNGLAEIYLKRKNYHTLYGKILSNQRHHTYGVTLSYVFRLHYGETLSNHLRHLYGRNLMIYGEQQDMGTLKGPAAA